MPLALEPNETFEIILESDKDKPREDQPRFIYRHLTCRQWRKVAKFQDYLEELKKDKSAKNVLDKMLDKIKETATTNLIGWVNMLDANGKLIPFDIEKFEDIIGLNEANELIAKLENLYPSVDEKKNLDSQPASDMAGSVSTQAKSVETPASVNTEGKKQQ